MNTVKDAVTSKDEDTTFAISTTTNISTMDISRDTTSTTEDAITPKFKDVVLLKFDKKLNFDTKRMCLAIVIFLLFFETKTCQNDQEEYLK